MQSHQERRIRLRRMHWFDLNSKAYAVQPWRREPRLLYGAGEDEEPGAWVEMSCRNALGVLTDAVTAGDAPRIAADDWEILAVNRPHATARLTDPQIDAFLRHRLLLPTGEDVWRSFEERLDAERDFVAAMPALVEWLRAGTDEPPRVSTGWLEALVSRSRQYLGFNERDMVDLRYLTFPLIPFHEIYRPTGSAPKIERRALTQLAQGIVDTMIRASAAAEQLGVPAFQPPAFAEPEARLMMRALAKSRTPSTDPSGSSEEAR